MSMSTPRDFSSFYDSRDSVSVPEVLPEYLYEGVQNTPGKVFRDAILYGVSPQECGPAVYDDENANTIDALSDPRVSATDAMDPEFYANEDYSRPDSLKSFFDDPRVSPTSSPQPEATTSSTDPAAPLE